jgi:hypothetical protein
MDLAAAHIRNAGYGGFSFRDLANAATQKGLDFLSDFGRQNAGLGAQDAKEAHLTILIESRSKTPIGRGL